MKKGIMKSASRKYKLRKSYFSFVEDEK